MTKITRQVGLMQHLSSLYRLVGLGLTFCLLAGLLSCGNLGRYGMNLVGVNIIPIREVKPQQDEQKTVHIQGRVERHVPLLGRHMYQINDSTGKIWVITNQTGLKQEEQVMIRGEIHYKSIPLAGKEFGEAYLEEK